MFSVKAPGHDCPDTSPERHRKRRWWGDPTTARRSSISLCAPRACA